MIFSTKITYPHHFQCFLQKEKMMAHGDPLRHFHYHHLPHYLDLHPLLDSY
jgi:hypothetical protein